MYETLPSSTIGVHKIDYPSQEHLKVKVEYLWMPRILSIQGNYANSIISMNSGIAFICLVVKHIAKPPPHHNNQQ